MNRIVKILVLLLIGFSVKSQVPAGLPSPNNTSYSKIGWSRADSGIINAPRDTTFRPKYIGTQIIWPHAGVDTNIWVWDGSKFFHYLKTKQDVINALGYTPLQNITAYISAGTNVTLSGSGTLLNPYVINASGGGGGGGVNSFAFTNGNGFAGTVLNSTTNPTLSLSVSVTGLLYGNGTALGATTIGAGLSFSGGALTNTINNTNQLTNGAGFISNIGGLVNAGTNITITGSGTSGSPFVINSSGGGSGITGAGNLSPLFTTSITSSTLNFALTNATAHRFFGNFTGSSAAPSFGTPSLDGGDFFNDGTTTTVLHGNAAGNLSFGKVSLGAGGDASGILDTLKGGTGVASPHFNFGYGILATGNFPNYTVSLDTANLKDTIRLFYNGATGDTLMHSLGGNLYSPRFIDSANFHHYFKADGTLVFYATGGASVAWGSITGTLSSQTDLNTALGLKAPLASPTFTGTPAAPTATAGTNTTQIATTAFVTAAVAAGGSGVALPVVTNITSGTSSTVPNGTSIIAFSPTSALTYTLTLPTTWHNGNELKICFIANGTITNGNAMVTLTLVAGSGQSLSNAVPVTSVTFKAGESIVYQLIGTANQRIN